MSISFWSNTRRVWLAAGVVSTAALVAVWSANARAAQPAPAGVSAPAACPHEQHMGGMGRDAKRAGAPMMSGMMPMAGGGMARMFKHLDLTAQQKDQIEKLQAAARPQMDQLREEGRSLHEQGRSLWSATQLDEAAIEQWRQKLNTHHEKMSQHMTRAMLDVAKVLTPEQRTKAVEFMQSRRDRHMKHGGGAGHAH